MLGVPDPALFARALGLAVSEEGPGGALAMEWWAHRLNFDDELTADQSREAYGAFRAASPSPARHRLAQGLLGAVNFSYAMEPGHYHWNEGEEKEWADFLLSMAAEAAVEPMSADFRAALDAARRRKASLDLESYGSSTAMVAPIRPKQQGEPLLPREAFQEEVDRLTAAGRFSEAAQLLEARLAKAPWETANPGQTLPALTELWLKAKAWDQVDRLWRTRYLKGFRAGDSLVDPGEIRSLPGRVEKVGNGALAQRMRTDYLFATYTQLPGQTRLSDLFPLSRPLEAALWAHAPVLPADSAAACLLRALEACKEGPVRLRIDLLEAAQRFEDALQVEAQEDPQAIPALVARALGYAEKAEGAQAQRLLARARAFLDHAEPGVFESCDRLVFDAHLQRRWGRLHLEAGRDVKALACFEQAFRTMTDHPGAATEAGGTTFHLDESDLDAVLEDLGPLQLKLGHLDACLSTLRARRKALDRLPGTRIPGGPPPPPAASRRGLWEDASIPWRIPGLAELRVMNLLQIRKLQTRRGR